CSSDLRPRSTNRVSGRRRRCDRRGASAPPRREADPRCALAARAVEGAATRHDAAHDRAAAARAGLALARVDLELALHAALVAAGIDVVAARRAPVADALAQDPTQRLAQPRDLLGAERPCLPPRV